jgi:hypothetical protein
MIRTTMTKATQLREHLVRGGVQGTTPGTGRRTHTRPVEGVAENTKLNRALWTLAQKMAELKGEVAVAA